MIKSLSKIFSLLFHPLLFPTIGTVVILACNPNLFGYFGQKLHVAWLIIVFALTFIFPLVWLVMMKRLEMINDLQLESSKERIIPFIAVATFYLWTAWMFKPNVNMKIPSNELLFFMMVGACLSIFASFFVNIFAKISLHSAALGSLLGLMLPMVRISPFDLRLVLVVSIIVAGIVGTARLKLEKHVASEIYAGYLVGFVGQFFAFSIIPKYL